MNEELKPCPFCGGKAEFIHDDGTCIEVNEAAGTMWFIGCTECPAVIGTGSKTETMSLWNRRAES